ncbi:MAG: peptidase MA family metallohydrolase [Gemmatimonadales bacterium]
MGTLGLTLLLLGAAHPAHTPRTLPQAEVRTGSLVFRYWPGHRAAAEALAAGLASAPAFPGLPPGILGTGEIVVYLAPNQATYDSLAPGAPDWSGGLAFPENDRIVLPTFAPRAGGRPLATVLRHELAHVALTRRLGSSVPRWFHEGYAQLASGSWNAKNAWALRLAILQGRLESLESLSLDFARGRVSADHAYLLSYTAVEFLYRLGGAEGFSRLLERWHELGELDPALRRTYGLTLGQFERLWRRDVGRRFGWLLVLAQAAVFWMVLTILLLVLGYWKKRRTRQKLEALEAAVAAREVTAGLEGTAEAGPGGRGRDVIDEVGGNE